MSEENAFALVDEPAGFDRAYYTAKFGLYHRTYVAGLKELSSLFCLAHPKNFKREALLEVVAGWRAVAVDNVPQTWRDEFTKDPYWSKVKPAEIMRACNGGLLRFDRACQAIKTMELAFKYSAAKGLQAIDVCAVVQMRPAIYTLIDHDAIGWVMRGTHDDLISDLCAGRKEATVKKAKQFLKRVGSGDAVTHANAERIRKHLVAAGVAASAPFSMIKSHRSGARACAEEACFVTLSPEASEKLSRKFDAAQSA